MFSVITKGDAVDIRSGISITEMNGSMWNKLAVEIEQLDPTRDARVLLHDPDGNVVVFGKFATSKNEAGYFIPFIENGPSGKREVLFHELDRELGFDLTGRTVLAKLNSGEKVSLARFHSDSVSGYDAVTELGRKRRLGSIKLKLKEERAMLTGAQIHELESELIDLEASLKRLPHEQSRLLKASPVTFQKMGLMDMVLGQTDRNGGNWMINSRGEIKAIDNARVLGTNQRFRPLDTYTKESLPTAAFGKIDPEAKQNLLKLTPERLEEILKARRIPAIYRFFSKRNLRRVQELLRNDASFGDIVEEMSRITAVDFVPYAIVASGAAGTAGVVYGIKSEN